MIFNKRRRWSHSSRVKLPLVNISASWFLVNMFDLDLGVQIDSVKWPIKRNSVDSWHVSHRWTSALNDHFDHCFIVFKDVQLRLALRRLCVCGNVIHMRQLINISVWVWICDSANSLLLLDWLVFWYCSMNATLLSPHPINQQQVIHPFANQHPTKWFLILLNCAKLKFVSYTSNWLEQTYDFQKYTRHPLRLALSPQGRQQSLSLETTPVSSVELHYPHDNAVGNRLCDECKKSVLLIICHMPASILWLILQACWLTIECQVY